MIHKSTLLTNDKYRINSRDWIHDLFQILTMTKNDGCHLTDVKEGDCRNHHKNQDRGHNNVEVVKISSFDIVLFRLLLSVNSDQRSNCTQVL